MSDRAFVLATWNLERPRRRSWRKLPAIQEILSRLLVDVWVLTETRTSLAPGEGYMAVHAPPHPARRPDSDERWVSLWSRLPVAPIHGRATPWAVGAIVESPVGQVAVYGTVLPYRNEPASSGQGAPAWSRFLEELKLQTEDWMAIRTAHPDRPLVVLGDLNQSLDDSGWYESARTKEMLRGSLDQAGLACVTTEDVVARGKLRTHHLIDHICISDSLMVAGEVSCWEPVRPDGVVLSDHPGVAVALTRRSQEVASFKDEL